MKWTFEEKQHQKQKKHDIEANIDKLGASDVN